MRHELYRFAAEANVLNGESWSAGEKCNRRAAGRQRRNQLELNVMLSCDYRAIGWRSEMGEVKVKVDLENYDDRAIASRGLLAEDRVRSQRVDVVVDSGAVMLVLPQDLVEALGLRTLRKAIVTYADERKEERDVAGVVSVRVAGRIVETNCVVGPPGSEPLLGQIVLKEADLLSIAPINGSCPGRSLLSCRH
jgi:predicted aspartyl protease